MSSRKTALVTGSSGLIGSEAVGFLDARGWVVHGVDNNLRREFFGEHGDTSPNLERLRRETTRFVHHDLDVRDRERIAALFGEHPPGLVVHCAAQPSHDLAARRPFDDFETNAVGTLNLLEAARRHCPESPFVFLSTNKVYGDAPNELPLVELATRWNYADPAHREGIDETCRVDEAMHSLFGASKLAADILVQEYGRYFGLPTVCLRGGCLAGPNHAGAELHGFLGAASFLSAFLEATRVAYDTRRAEPQALAFKTIETPYVDDFVRVFADLRCVHIVREPSANYASAKRTWTLKGYPFYIGSRDQLRTFLEARWLPHARAIVRLTERDPDRHLLVRCEDLRADARAAVGRICDWLGVEPPPDPEQLTVLGGRRLTTMPPNPSQIGIDPPPRVVGDMERQFGYEEVLSDRERALIARCTGTLARPLGYEGRPPSSGRLGALRLWLGWLRPDESERVNVHSKARWALQLVRRRLYVTRKLAGSGAR